MIVETVYLGRDNTIDLLLKDEKGPVDLADVTKVDLVLSDTVTVSDSVPTDYPIQWSGTGATGKIIMQLGGEDIPAGSYRARLIIYDPSNPDGIVWDELGIVVK